MKLIRFGEAGSERPGVLLDDGSRLDVSDFVSDYDEAFFALGGIDVLRNWLKTHSPTSRVPSTQRLGPPICRPSKIICIGLNYRDHAAETGAAIPKEPVIFFKATTGTPAGVGLAMKPPPQYLKSGDVVELGIKGLGESRQCVVNFSEQHYSKTA